MVHWVVVNSHTFAIQRTLPHRVDTWSGLYYDIKWLTCASYNWFRVLCLIVMRVIFVLQIQLSGFQCLRAIFPDSASSLAARPVPPVGFFTQTGGPKPGGGGRSRPQLEGWAHDASGSSLLCHFLFKEPVPEALKSHAGILEMASRAN